MIEINMDFYKEEEEDIEEISEKAPFSMVMDLSNVRPAEIEIEDEIRMGYLRMKYKKTSK